MPNQPATPNRSIRIPDELWDDVQRRADDLGITATEVVLRALRAFLR